MQENSDLAAVDSSESSIKAAVERGNWGYRLSSNRLFL